MKKLSLFFTILAQLCCTGLVKAESAVAMPDSYSAQVAKNNSLH